MIGGEWEGGGSAVIGGENNMVKFYGSATLYQQW